MTLIQPPLPKVCAVSYLNTTPLIWGLQNTALGQQVDLTSALPSECADRVREGKADIGILPVVEIERQGLQWLPGVGIACRGEVRSILLVSKTPLSRIQKLAADIGSRTSVMLARILLAERHSCEPAIVAMRADLDAMLAVADAALIIGDPALLLDPVALRARYEVLDLGQEWVDHTGYPMIFALWSGHSENLRPGLADLFIESYRSSLPHLAEIVANECPPRGIEQKLGSKYLTEHIAFELNARDYQGMEIYLRYTREFDTLKVSV